MAFGAVTIAVVGVGLWLGSGQQPVPIAAAPESAVVVSSLACTDGAGATIVDVLEPMGAPGSGPVRVELDACGYLAGQRLQVQFVPGDRSQVVLAGNESATDFLTGDRMPVGLAIAGVLVLGGVLLVWLDGRRSRGGSLGRRRRNTVWRSVFQPNADRPTGPRRGGSATHQAIDADETMDPDQMAADRVIDPAEPASAGLLDPTASVFGDTMVLSRTRPQSGRHALPEQRELGSGEHGPLSAIQVITFPPPAERPRADAQPEPAPAAPAKDDTDQLVQARRSLTSVDLTFPFSSSLAACLHDELFTHRTSPG